MADGGAHPLQRLLLGQHPGHGEKADLHHRVDPPAHAGAAGDPACIDQPHHQAQLPQPLALALRQPPPGFGRLPGAVDQQQATGFQPRQRIETLQEIPVVHRHQGGPLDQIRGTDRPRPKAQVRHRERARLLGVVDEITLHKQGRGLTDDLDRALVGPHRAVTAKAVDHRPHLSPAGLPEGLADRGRWGGEGCGGKSCGGKGCGGEGCGGKACCGDACGGGRCGGSGRTLQRELRIQRQGAVV